MKLSIIIPVKNEEFLIKKIVTHLENKLQNLSYEIIFINDFSTDNTVKVTKELIKDKPQINIYGNKRKGLGGAITQGINNANGEAVCIMMSDLSDSIDDLEKYYLCSLEKKMGILKKISYMLKKELFLVK